MKELDEIRIRLSEIRLETIKLNNEEQELINKVDSMEIDFRTKFVFWFYSDLDEDINPYLPSSKSTRDWISNLEYKRRQVVDLTNWFEDRNKEGLNLILDFNEFEIEELVSKGEVTSYEYQKWLEIAKDMYKEKFKKFTIDWL